MNPINQANDFWLPERIELLRKLVKTLSNHVDRHPITLLSASINDEMLSYKAWFAEQYGVSAPISPATEKQVRDFVNGNVRKPRDLSIVTFIAAYVERSVRVAADSRSLIFHEDQVAEASSLISKLWKHCQQTNVAVGRVPYDLIADERKRAAFIADSGVPADRENPLAVVSDVQKVLGTQRFAAPTMDRFFGDPENSRAQRNFIVLRYSVEANRISKEFVQIRQPNSVFPFLHFARFYKDLDDRQREANGLVIGTEFATYLFGSFDRGRSIYCSAMNTFSLHLKSFSGIQLASDSAGKIYSSRVIFNETELEDSRDCDIGIKDADAFFLESPQLEEDLKNEINIYPSDLTLNGEAISSYDAVRHFGAILEGTPPSQTVSRRSGEPYNPANPSTVPFSSALLMKVSK